MELNGNGITHSLDDVPDLVSEDQSSEYEPASPTSINSSSSSSSSEPQDPTMILSREKVASARADTSGRVYRVYCDGVFDLFHLGHMRMLEQAKKSLSDSAKVYLLCGVCSDELVHKYKGKTVMDHQTRCDSARHCKWVDEVCEDAPWVISDEFIAKYRIDFVAHDAIPYKDTSGTASSSSDVYAHIKQRGMFLETQRTNGISTSDIIVDIVRQYDEFVQRNLSRGYTKEQLNVGRSWEMRAKFHEKQAAVKRSVNESRHNFHQLNQAIRDFIKEFSPKKNLYRRSFSASSRSSKLHFTPDVYVKNLAQHLPAAGEGIIHHAWGLTKALFATSCTLLSYANPFSYSFKVKKH